MSFDRHTTASQLLAIIEEKRRAHARLVARTFEAGTGTVERTGLHINRQTGTIELMQLTGQGWKVCDRAGNLPLSDFPALESSTI